MLWKKSLSSRCCVELQDDTPLMCKISSGQHTIALLNVYLPYDNGSNLGEYSFYLSKVDSVLNGYPYAAAIGDFNANIANKHHRFGAELDSVKRRIGCSLITPFHQKTLLRFTVMHMIQ